MPREAKVRLGEGAARARRAPGDPRDSKKDPGADPEPPTNAEKAAVEAPRAEYGPCEILPVMGMAKSSYEYAGNAQAKGETEGRAAARKAVVEAFEASGGTCGHRRIAAAAGASDRAVRGIMRDEGLVARAAKKKRRHSPFGGEISEAPPNLLRDEEGKHRFGADGPNELRVTDVTEFRIPAGKVCLSPIAYCFDGMPLSWSISTSPDAEMANSSPIGACGWLSEGDRPTARSDRGKHCRRPGWIRICRENGPVRSMPGKGCSPDNARREGFFGRLKIEFFYGCDWSKVAIEEFTGMLNACLRWYGDVRIKSDLDYRSPMQCRRDLGLPAA